MECFTGVEAVVHLAGESLMAIRWTKAKKSRIYESRVKGTKLLAGSLASLPGPPGVLVCASAIGYYGNRGDEFLAEDSTAGLGFLAEVCRDWEAAAEPARQKGIRTVHARLGVVLSPEGGALRAMLPAFRMGIGGRLGSGRQYMSWIALADTVHALHRCLTDESLSGPVNIVSPEPVTNREFTRALAKAVRRPAFIPVPAVALKLILGGMGEEMLLSGARVLPRKLMNAGFPFRHISIETALKELLAGS